MLYDYIIVGGGIVGISTAWQLLKREPGKKILLLEKEPTFASHQTGHNSGVIHAGVYYSPGSLKATFCKAGVDATISFCRENDLPYLQCGKLIVATNPSEVGRMHALFARAQENGIDVTLQNESQLKAREPNISGMEAIFVKSTAIVNYQQVAIKMAEHFSDLGGEAKLNHEVIDLKEEETFIAVSAKLGRDNIRFKTKFLITCSGLMADRTTQMLGIPTDFRVIPFRGIYYRLPQKYNDIVRHLIYPVPDPDYPFLGVHLTRMIDGSVTVGPNAVLSLTREGYGKVNIDLQDLYDMASFKGFWKIARDNLAFGITEAKNSLWKRGYLKTVQKYCPQLELADLLPYPAGIRAQTVSRDGKLINDFLFAQSDRSLHVCNAPSPAATSSIPIGRYICDKVLEKVS